MKNHLPSLPITPKIVAHHVGARDFGGALYVPERFRGDVVHVLYEADSECVERMIANEKNLPQAQFLSEKHVLPFCLGASRRQAKLNITANSYASSVFDPDPTFTNNYCEIPIDEGTYDVVYGPMLEVIRQVDVEIQDIDTLFAEDKIPVRHFPDFLSLDTQGYELEIIKGASESIARSVLGIVSEVEIQSMYSGQPLLHDVLKDLRERGFIFAGFTAYYEVSPFRAPIGLRGKAFPGFGDALFFRDVNGLTEDEFGTDQLFVMLVKLAFLATSFSFTEYALLALQKAGDLRPRVTPSLLAEVDATTYGRFLLDVARLAERQEHLLPPVHSVPDASRAEGDGKTSWYDRYHQSALARYRELGTQPLTPPPPPPPPPAPAPVVETIVEKQDDSSAKSRGMRGLLERLFGPGESPTAAADSATADDTAAASVVVPPVSPAPQPESPPQEPHPWAEIKAVSDFEQLLEEWGFAGPAYFVRQRRQVSERFVRSLDTELKQTSQETLLPASSL